VLSEKKRSRKRDGAFDKGKCSVSRPGRFTRGKGYRYPSNRMLGGPQSRYERFGERKILLTLPELEPCIIQPVVKSLYRLPLPSYSYFELISFWNVLCLDENHC